MHIFLILFSFLLISCSGLQPRYHTVALRETLAFIASRYGVGVEELKKSNRLADAKTIHVGTKLYLPFETMPGWDAEYETYPTVRDNNMDPQVQKVSRTSLGEPAVSRNLAAVRFLWPVRGAISSRFGKRQAEMHDGIDIVARAGTEVRASRSGHVIYATDQISGYGNMIILRHADRFSTVYAHLSKMHVKKGQFVTRGDFLGRVGQTGRATSPHLHFEVRDNRLPVNPLLYLQEQYAINILAR